VHCTPDSWLTFERIIVGVRPLSVSLDASRMAKNSSSNQNTSFNSEQCQQRNQPGRAPLSPWPSDIVTLHVKSKRSKTETSHSKRVVLAYLWQRGKPMSHLANHLRLAAGRRLNTRTTLHPRPGCRTARSMYGRVANELGPDSLHRRVLVTGSVVWISVPCDT